MKVKGYIEGYYGKILNWNERISILKTLKDLNLNTYFYAPKEDIYQRLQWRKPYPKDWLVKFKNFCHIAHENKISVIYGISPGLDFNFKDSEKDYFFLINKINSLLDSGADNIALMFDDIIEIKEIKKNSLGERGYFHGLMAKKVSKILNKKNFFVVPEIYADEIYNNPEDYFTRFCQNLPLEIRLFLTGEQIVSKNLEFPKNLGKIPSLIKNEVIYWDNYYCNDYCPRRIFVGKWINRDRNLNLLLNGTGLIETDKLLLNLMKIGDNTKKWREALINHKVPKEFFNVSKFFDKPYFEKSFIEKIVIDKAKFLKSIDFLLWSWKEPISREWYPYIFGLKQDFLIYYKDFSTERVFKTQTHFSSKHINNSFIKNNEKS